MLLTITNKLEGTGEITPFMAEVILTPHGESVIKSPEKADYHDLVYITLNMTEKLLVNPMILYDSLRNHFKDRKRKLIEGEEKKIRGAENKYFESTLGHFGIFIVKLQPLLDDTADAGVRVVDKLEASDVRPTFPQVCQVNVQEALRQEVDRQKMRHTGRKINRTL